MENLVTHAWVNGQWTQQTISREQLMAQNQQAEPVFPVAERDPPVYGLLSRTLVHSPVINQILPAKIRSGLLDDVVFIGLNRIDLYNFGVDGKLRLLASKNNFKAKIRHAQVIGAPYHILNGNPDVKPHPPQHVVALTLDSGHISFVYAKDVGKDNDDESVEFVVSTKRIGSQGPHPDHLGASIAVDPRSRALAVAATDSVFRIYALYSLEELQDQVEHGLPLKPLKEERTFHVNGMIAKMEFLHPAPGDRDHVILLLYLIGSKHNARLQLYEWTCTKSLQTATKHGHQGLRLSEDISMPLLLIPLLVESAFLILTEDAMHVVRASDIVSGNAFFTRIPFPGPSPNGLQRSLAAAWARAPRHRDYMNKYDDIYVAFENGDIYFLEVDPQYPQLIQSSNMACHLDCTIDTAFAALDLPPSSHPDFLVAGGEMSSGGVYLLELHPHMVSRPRLEKSVANWSPVADFELVNLSAQGCGAGRDRVYACTGRGIHGAITEIRRGCPARIQLIADYLQGIRRLFILPDSSRKGYFVLSSFADSSELCFLPPTGDFANASDTSALALEETTLAAGSITENRFTADGANTQERILAVQVTPISINIAELAAEDFVTSQNAGDIDMDSENESSRFKARHQCNDDVVITAAAFIGSHIVYSQRSGATVNLTLALISLSNKSDDWLSTVGTPTRLLGEPTFLNVIDINGRTVVIIGTRQASLSIYMVDLKNGLVPKHEESLMIEGGDWNQIDLFICESAVLLVANGEYKLLCGLRGGTVVLFDMQISSQSGQINLERVRAIEFGPIPVQLHIDIYRKDSAYLLAGPELYRCNILKGRLNASQVVFEDAVMEPSIQAVVQVDKGIIVCATKEQIFYAEIEDGDTECSRRIRLYETPRRLLFFHPLNVLVVACNADEQGLAHFNTAASQDPTRFGKPKTTPTKDHDARRVSTCSLRLLDPRSGEFLIQRDLRDDRENARNELIFNKPNEMIYCLTEWNVVVDNKLFRYIVVGTSYRSLTNGKARKGRLLILTITSNETGIEVKRRFQVPCDKPVYSVTSYGIDSILFCCGNMLVMKTLKDRKLTEVDETKLRSPGVQISVSEPYINVSCEIDSLVVLKLENGKFSKAYSDEMARNSLHHFSFNDGFTLATDKESTIVGLWRPPDRRNMESLHTLFEAELRGIVSRIRRGYCFAPWQTRHRTSRKSSTEGQPPVLAGVRMPEMSIIASTINGAFYQLTILDKDALLLLRYVQDLYNWSNGSTRKVPTADSYDMEEYQNKNPQLGHVDGDILEKAAKLGPKWLEDTASKVESGKMCLSRFRSEVKGFLKLGPEENELEALVAYIMELVDDAIL